MPLQPAHPIVLVLIATLLSIPQVTKWIARNQATDDARTQKGLDAVAAAFQVERDLNVVTTLFYAFGRDFGVPRRTPDAYASAQHDLRQSLIQLWGLSRSRRVVVARTSRAGDVSTPRAQRAPTPSV